MDYINSILESSLFRNIVIAIVAIAITVLVIAVTRRVYKYYYQKNRSSVLLELTPPSRGDRAPDATNQLFISLSGLANSKSFLDRLLGRETYFSLEIVSTRKQGIRYVVRCPKHLSDVVEHIVASYTPDIKVKKTVDYKINDSGDAKILEFKQKTHFAYPLKAYDALEEHDPISYLTNAMTKLKDGELMVFQLLIKPVNVPEAKELSQKIKINDQIFPKMSGKSISVLSPIVGLLNTILMGTSDAITSVFHGSSSYSNNTQSKSLEHDRQVAEGIKPARTLSRFEQEQVEAISYKLEQPFFEVDMRMLIQIKDKAGYTARKQTVRAALDVYNVPNTQSLTMRTVKHHLLGSYSLKGFRHRLPSFYKAHRNILAVSEVVSLYHFPHSVSAKTENVVKSLSKTLPAPISLKGNNKLDVIIGNNVHHGVTTPIGLTEAERQRHMYVIGGTGNGKTTMLLYGIVQDIKNGKGLAVVDPHGDLAETILEHIPEDRIKDVIYFNPDDLAHPVGMNLLEMPEGLTGDELLREKDVVTESVISVLRKIFSEDDSGGHRIEYVLRNSIQTALTIEGATLFTIFRLLNDSKYRREVIQTLDDEDLINFWKNEMGKAGDFQRVKMAAGITAKIGRFLFSASAKRVLEQPKSTIDFDDILDSGKILICNFSKGRLGEDTSSLFGITVLAKLQVASLRRARLQQSSRKSFYLYVDEFQNFATMSFVQMLSEARKYKLFLTMAEQSTSQQDQQRMVDIILANVGTVVCFRSGNPSDEQLILPLYQPYIEEGEIANLPAYNYYVRISAIHSQEPLSGVTVVVEDIGNKEIAKKVITSSQTKYAIKAKPKEEAPPKHKPTADGRPNRNKSSKNRKKGAGKDSNSFASKIPI